MLSRSSDAARIHVPAEPPSASCSRADFNLDNPPMFALGSPGATSEFTWYGVGDQYERDPGYPEEPRSMTTTCLVSDEEIARDGTPLCDPDEVPAGIETFRTVTDAAS